MVCSCVIVIIISFVGIWPSEMGSLPEDFWWNLYDLHYFRTSSSWWVEFPLETYRKLVGGWATPLKKMSQLGWWNSQLNGKIKHIPNISTPPTRWVYVGIIMHNGIILVKQCDMMKMTSNYDRFLVINWWLRHGYDRKSIFVSELIISFFCESAPVLVSGLVLRVLVLDGSGGLQRWEVMIKFSFRKISIKSVYF